MNQSLREMIKSHRGKSKLLRNEYKELFKKQRCCFIRTSNLELKERERCRIFPKCFWMPIETA